MTAQEYIIKEKKVMERECSRKGMSFSEWVARYAVSYHKKHIKEVVAPGGK